MGRPQGGQNYIVVLGILIALLIGCVRPESQAEKPDTLRIITRHQQYRGLLNSAADMIKMTWSNNLEKIAANVVKKCPTSREALLNMSQLSNLGVNVGSVPYPTPVRDGYPEDIQTSIIDQWGSERSNYRIEGGCPSAPCNSWWQIVWSKVSHIGCSLNNCGNRTTMVCIYSSRADPETDHPFKTGNSCSACPEGFERCENQMCTSESQNPVEPDFQLEAFEKDEDSNDNEGYKEVEQNRNNNSDNNPYAAASGTGGQFLDHESSDSATQLTVPFVTFFTLLLLGILA